MQTTEAGEETADVSSTPEATHASTVQVVQPTKSRTGQSSPSARCLVHQYDTISEISSEELTEFGELLQVPEQVEETSQEVILTVPSIGCIETIPSVCENQRQAIHTVTETEILYSESEDLVRTNDSTEEIFVKTETQESLCSSSDQNTLSDNMEAVGKFDSHRNARVSKFVCIHYCLTNLGNLGQRSRVKRMWQIKFDYL